MWLQLAGVPGCPGIRLMHGVYSEFARVLGSWARHTAVSRHCLRQAREERNRVTSGSLGSGGAMPKEKGTQAPILPSLWGWFESEPVWGLW